MNKNDTEAFYRLYSTKIGSGDVAQARKAYGALLQTITEILRRQERVELPQLAELVIKVRPPVKNYSANKKQMIDMAAQKILRVRIHKNYKDYIKNMRTIADDTRVISGRNTI